MNKKKSIFRILAILLLFTVTITFSFKPKKAEAIVLVDDVAIVLGLAGLSLLGYKVMTSDKEMLKDIGRSAYNALGDLVDYSFGSKSVYAKLTDNIGQKLTDDYIRNSFSTPKVVSTFNSFPYGARYLNGYKYGTVTLNGAYNFKISIFKDGIHSYDNEIKVDSNELTWTLETEKSNDSRGRIMLYSNSIWVTGINEAFLDTSLVSFELTCIDKNTGLPVTEQLKQDITIPYDGSQVTMLDTPADVKVGTTVTIPKDVTLDGIPGTITDVKDLPVDVTQDGATGGGEITGWDWLDKILWGILGVLQSILDGILAIPKAITGIYDWCVAFPSSISAWWDSLWTESATLDFTPLAIVTEKFPFCIPWDFVKLIKTFDSPKVSPKIGWDEIPLGDLGVSIPAFEFDFDDVPLVNTLLAILRFFELAFFVVFLIMATRNYFVKG